MQSQWYELKPAVLAMRRRGVSLSFIADNLGIPRSTLSAWCKEITLTPEQRTALADSKRNALQKARAVAAEQYRTQKQEAARTARQQAATIAASLPLSPELLSLALALLYRGDGKQSGSKAISSNDPELLRFFIYALLQTHDITPADIRCKLRLKEGQDEGREVAFWSQKINVPASQFKPATYTKSNRPAKDHEYHGICSVQVSGIAIQQELVYLYKSFASRVFMGD
jgi:hypothetical protein